MYVPETNMAAPITQRCYLFCHGWGMNIIRHSVKLRTSGISDILQPGVGYGTKETGTAQDTQVNIPLERLSVSYSRSSGPGGQHVNKVNTKAEVRFHVQTADWIPEDIRQKIFEKNKNRINKAGELLVTSELSRSQQRNLTDCIEKISAIIADASEKPYEPTAEAIALRAARLEKRNKERLKQKKISSAIKQSRRMDFD